MKPLFLIAVILTCASVYASDVKWNFVEAQQYPSGEIGLEETLKNGESSWVGFSLFFTATVSSENVMLSNFNCNLATAITWVSMAADDIVCSAAFGDGIPSLFSTEYPIATGEFTAAANQPFYLAFQVFELVEGMEGISRGEAYYGWVEFVASDIAGVELISSAVNLAGNEMVVGGEPVATPEPSTGVLLLLGLAGLALRRPQRRCHVSLRAMPSIRLSIVQ